MSESTPTPTDPREERPKLPYTFKTFKGHCENCETPFEIGGLILDEEKVQSTNSKLAADLKNALDGQEYYKKEADVAAERIANLAAEVERLKTACEKEFQSVEQLSGENMKLAAEIAELREANAVLQSQVDNADVNLEQVRMIEKGKTATLRAELEALKTSKRPFSDKLAGEVIDSQVKRITELETKLSANIVELDELEAKYDELHGIHVERLTELETAKRTLFQTEKRLDDKLRTALAELEAQKQWRNEAEEKLIECGQEIANHVAELDAVRKERDEYAELASRALNQNAELNKQHDTALAAKDAAERERDRLNNIARGLANGLRDAVSLLESAHDAIRNGANPDWDAVESEMNGFDMLLTTATVPRSYPTPAPTQEPPAGVVTISLLRSRVERDHWKATAELHYNARLELERERDRKGGDSSCAPSKEPTHPDSSKCASNSPADVPSEGRGECVHGIKMTQVCEKCSRFLHFHNRGRGELLPFNLSDALAGKPVACRNGMRATKFQIEDPAAGLVRFPYKAWIDVEDGWLFFNSEGKYLPPGEEEYDLFMLPTEGSGA